MKAATASGPIQMLRPEDVAEILGVNRAAVFKLPIPHYTLGKRLHRWSLPDVQKYIDSKPRPLEVLEAEQILAKATPAPNKAGIYFLIFEGEIVYIGQSICPLRRLGDHSTDKGKFFDAYVFVPCDWRDLSRLESVYIYKYQPKYNKVGIHTRGEPPTDE